LVKFLDPLLQPCILKVVGFLLKLQREIGFMGLEEFLLEIFLLFCEDLHLVVKVVDLQLLLKL